MSDLIYYKIRSKNTGLFLKGTPTYHSYDKSGRLFQTLGKTRTFITTVLKRPDSGKIMDSWEIIEYKVQEHAVKQVHEIVSPATLIKILKR